MKVKLKSFISREKFEQPVPISRGSYMNGKRKDLKIFFSPLCAKTQFGMSLGVEHMHTILNDRKSVTIIENLV